jgi:hypothetical protein
MQHTQQLMEVSNNFNINDIFDYDKNFENIKKYVIERLSYYSHGCSLSVSKKLNTLRCLINLYNLLNKYNIKLYFGTLNTLLFSNPIHWQCTPRYIFYTDHNIVINVSNINAPNGSDTRIHIKSINSDEINFELFANYDGYFKWNHIESRTIIDLHDGSSCLVNLNKAKKYIHPSIYVDYLLHCNANEINQFSNKKMEDLQRENTDIKKTLEKTTQTLIKKDKKLHDLNNELKEKTRIVYKLKQKNKLLNNKLKEIPHIVYKLKQKNKLLNKPNEIHEIDIMTQVKVLEKFGGELLNKKIYCLNEIIELI